MEQENKPRRQSPGDNIREVRPSLREKISKQEEREEQVIGALKNLKKKWRKNTEERREVKRLYQELNKLRQGYKILEGARRSERKKKVRGGKQRSDTIKVTQGMSEEKENELGGVKMETFDVGQEIEVKRRNGDLETGWEILNLDQYLKDPENGKVVVVRRSDGTKLLLSMNDLVLRKRTPPRDKDGEGVVHETGKAEKIELGPLGKKFLDDSKNEGYLPDQETIRQVLIENGVPGNEAEMAMLRDAVLHLKTLCGELEESDLNAGDNIPIRMPDGSIGAFWKYWIRDALGRFVLTKVYPGLEQRTQARSFEEIKNLRAPAETPPPVAPKTPAGEERFKPTGGEADHSKDPTVEGAVILTGEEARRLKKAAEGKFPYEPGEKVRVNVGTDENQKMEDGWTIFHVDETSGMVFVSKAEQADRSTTSILQFTFDDFLNRRARGRAVDFAGAPPLERPSGEPPRLHDADSTATIHRQIIWDEKAQAKLRGGLEAITPGVGDRVQLIVAGTEMLEPKGRPVTKIEGDKYYIEGSSRGFSLGEIRIISRANPWDKATNFRELAGLIPEEDVLEKSAGGKELSFSYGAVISGLEKIKRALDGGNEPNLNLVPRKFHDRLKLIISEYKPEQPTQTKEEKVRAAIRAAEEKIKADEEKRRVEEEARKKAFEGVGAEDTLPPKPATPPQPETVGEEVVQLPVVFRSGRTGEQIPPEKIIELAKKWEAAADQQVEIIHKQAEAHGGKTLEAIRSLGNWWKGKPLSSKLLLSTGLITAGLGAVAAGSPIGIAAITIAGAGTRLFGAATTYVAVEALLEKNARNKGGGKDLRTTKRVALDAGSAAFISLFAGAALGSMANEALGIASKSDLYQVLREKGTDILEKLLPFKEYASDAARPAAKPTATPAGPITPTVPHAPAPEVAAGPDPSASATSVSGGQTPPIETAPTEQQHGAAAEMLHKPARPVDVLPGEDRTLAETERVAESKPSTVTDEIEMVRGEREKIIEELKQKEGRLAQARVEAERLAQEKAAAGEVRPEAPTQHLFEVKKGDTLWNFIGKSLEDSPRFAELTRDQKVYAIDSIKRSIEWRGDEGIKALGISSGEINVIKPGEKINLSSVFENKDLLDRVFEKASKVTSLSQEVVGDVVEKTAPPIHPSTSDAWANEIGRGFDEVKETGPTQNEDGAPGQLPQPKTDADKANDVRQKIRALHGVVETGPEATDVAAGAAAIAATTVAAHKLSEPRRIQEPQASPSVENKLRAIYNEQRPLHEVSSEAPPPPAETKPEVTSLAQAITATESNTVTTGEETPARVDITGVESSVHAHELTDTQISRAAEGVRSTAYEVMGGGGFGITSSPASEEITRKIMESPAWQALVKERADVMAGESTYGARRSLGEVIPYSRAQESMMRSKLESYQELWKNLRAHGQTGLAESLKIKPGEIVLDYLTRAEAVKVLAGGIDLAEQKMNTTVVETKTAAPEVVVTTPPPLAAITSIENLSSKEGKIVNLYEDKVLAAIYDNRYRNSEIWNGTNNPGGSVSQKGIKNILAVDLLNYDKLDPGAGQESLKDRSYLQEREKYGPTNPEFTLRRYLLTLENETASRAKLTPLPGETVGGYLKRAVATFQLHGRPLPAIITVDGKTKPLT